MLQTSLLALRNSIVLLKMKISSEMEARAKRCSLREEAFNSGKGKIFYICLRCFLHREENQLFYF